jgi:O-antigen ligase
MRASSVPVLDTVAHRPSAALRMALRLLQFGVLFIVIAVVTYNTFELDRFFVPKEAVLHALAFGAGLLCIGAFGRLTPTRADALLAAFLVVSGVSAVFATNGWIALRALAISASGIAVYWAARTLRVHGLGRPLSVAIAAAVVLGAVTSLLQTYGVSSDYFSVNRAPGGTLGNRNFIAHMAAFGLPVVLYIALTARRRGGYVAGAAGAALVTATLVLTRSRAGWLAFAAAMFVLLVGMVASGALRRSSRAWGRFVLVLGVGAAAVAGAVLLPNSLRWRSESPYLESIRALTEHREGSGRGRLVQWQQSVRMTLAHPLLGVGPGNWAVEYPANVRRGDPSLDGRSPGMTANPWPSSDWVAFLSERGPVAVLLLLAAFALIAWRALLHLLRADDPDDALAAAALLATLAAALVAGAFDAVLLLALPALLVWTTLGALAPVDTDTVASPTAVANAQLDDPQPVPPPTTLPRRRWRFRPGLALLILALAGGAATARSAGALAAMRIHDTRSDLESLRRAARLDPGNYRLQLRLARAERGREARCRYALAANALYPYAQAARQLSRGCRPRNG